MSRIKMYKDVLDDIRALADSLGALVAAMESDEGEKTEPVKKEKKAEPEKAPEKKSTLEEVRQALTAKSGEGHTAEVKALLMKHGGNKLSEIKEEEYAALLEEVKEIG